jgi:outer membrane protein OmpA-like peptidoglycan-associated protein
MSRTGHILFATVLTVCVWEPGAHAQRGVDAELFHPALDSYGIFEVDRADVSRQWEFGVRVFSNFAANPLRLTLTDPTDPMHVNTVREVLLSRQTALDFGLHVGLTNFLELVLDVPVSVQSFTPAFGSNGAASDPMLARTGFYATGSYTNVAPPDASPLDARVGFKVKMFRKGAFGLGASAIVTLPFGDESAFLGDSSFTFQPKLIADVTRGPVTFAMNLGAVIRQETRVYDPYDQAGVADHSFTGSPRLLLDVGHELTASAGLAYRFVHWVGIGAEVSALIPLVGEQKDYTVDVLGGLQIFPWRSLVIAVGAGAGVLASADRRDDYRVFLGLSWSTTQGSKGPLVGGGLDSDNDGIPDAQDVCPNEPEDRDGFDDEDGCPDTDNDQDGIPDSRDRCPNEPEDRDGFEDEDGCPDTDNDRDGIADAQDRCPNEPEDRDGFQDDDGCPDADNDGDGIPDALDKCPNEPETRNGVDDDDGCPDTGGAVVVTAQRITLPTQIQFDTGRATLAARSEALLGHVADKIKSLPRGQRIRIEGHTDDVGTAEKNQQLSQARAEQVRDWLIQKGIEPDRLQAVGYGNTRPLDTHKSAEARARNRRVEFIIVEQER